MKIASGSVAVFCFMLIVTANETWGFCGVNGTSGIPDCSVYEKVYPIYKILENIVTNDNETLYLMRQAFFPAILRHFLEASETVNVVRIAVCWLPNKTRPLPACNGLDSNQTVTETQCKNFRWSRSPGLNMISFDQLRAFDPVFTSWIYSRYVDHTYRRSFSLQFDMSSDVFPCTPTEEELTQATILLLTWSKAYAKAQGVPTTWRQEDQGHIARWYNYYSAESYYGSKEIGENIRIILFIVFILLNLVILLTIKYTLNTMKCSLDQIFSDQGTSSNIYFAVGITSTSINFAYLIYAVLVYPIRFSMAECTAIIYWKCSPSHNSSLYQVELTAFIVRMLIVIFAIITDLVVVIKVSKETEQFKPRWWCLSNKCYRLVHIILLLNIFLFVQIWLGVISLPAAILLIIAPLQTISALCAAVLIVAFFAGSILYLLHYGINYPHSTIIYRFGYFLWHLSFVVLTDALVIGLGFLYFNVLPQGGSLSIRAVFISLLPPVLLSVGSWVVKTKFLTTDAEIRQR